MTSANFSEKANFIWQVADDTPCVSGALKGQEYGDAEQYAIGQSRLEK